VALRARPDLVDHDRALEARVVGELSDGLLERAGHDRSPRALVALERVELDRLARGQKRDAAARDDALFEGRPGGPKCVLDPPRPLQDVPAVDLVVERVEASPGIGLGRPVERSFWRIETVGIASKRDCGVGISGRAHGNRLFGASPAVPRV
jgi:hypothetical protein